MSDSSSEEDNNRFREAVDYDLVAQNGQNADVKFIKTPKRKFEGDGDGSVDFYQTLLSKRLAELLDKQIKEVKPRNSDDVTSDNSQSKKKKSGIRLFTSSKRITEFEELHELPAKFQRKAAPPSESDSEDEKRFAEAVVTPEWVLGRKGVYSEPSRDQPGQNSLQF